MERIPGAGLGLRHPLAGRIARERSTAAASHCCQRLSAASGHDENIPFGVRGRSRWCADLARRLREMTLAIYVKAAAYAATQGILIADTKFEYGFVGDQLVLADEVLTPDSSRFWPAATYSPGGAQPSYDKQYVRDYLESIHWNKKRVGAGLCLSCRWPGQVRSVIK